MAPPTPAYVQGALRESANIEISTEEIQQIMDNDWFLVVLAPTIDDDLYAGQQNTFLIACSTSCVRELTKGRNWNNAHVLSARKLRGDG